MEKYQETIHYANYCRDLNIKTSCYVLDHFEKNKGKICIDFWTIFYKIT